MRYEPAGFERPWGIQSGERRRPIFLMNLPDLPEQDARLRDLLRQSHPAPGLRPGFRGGVWRRLETSGEEESIGAWVASTWRALLTPRWAFATLVLAMFGGTYLGTSGAENTSRLRAQERYVSSVVPWQQR